MVKQETTISTADRLNNGRNKMKEFKVYYSITGEFNENESLETKSEADKFYNDKVSEGIWDRVEKNY